MRMRAKTLPVHRVVTETLRDWIAGIAVALAFAMLAGILDSRDDDLKRRERQLADLAHTKALLVAERAKADATTRIELIPGEPNGFACRQFHIRPNWSKAVAEKCDDLGRTLTNARTIP